MSWPKSKEWIGMKILYFAMIVALAVALFIDHSPANLLAAVTGIIAGALGGILEAAGTWEKES